jgi:hypothetical protein
MLPFDINSVVFHFDDFNYGRRSQPYFILTIATQLFFFIAYNEMNKYISHCSKHLRSRAPDNIFPDY